MSSSFVSLFCEFGQQSTHLVQLPVLLRDLVLQPVEPRPDGHGLDVPPPVDAVVVGARLAKGLVKPPLQLLDPHHHIQVALRVLLNHIPHVIRLPSLTKCNGISSEQILDQTCWNLRRATKYLIFLTIRIAFLCWSVRLRLKRLKSHEGIPPCPTRLQISFIKVVKVTVAPSSPGVTQNDF